MRAMSSPTGGNEAEAAETAGTTGNLEVVIVKAIEALTSLDADCLEVLSRELEISARSISSAELERARSAHLVLGYLLQQTCRNLELFERIHDRNFDKYPTPPRRSL
jgi:hypothetical protein